MSAEKKLTSFKYNSVVFKLSGNALQDPYDTRAISPTATKKIANIFAEVIASPEALATDFAFVFGAGNIAPRGKEVDKNNRIERIRADYSGMSGTVSNGNVFAGYLKTCLTKAIENDPKNQLIKEHVQKRKIRIVSSLDIQSFAERFVYEKVLDQQKERSIFIFVGGTGWPGFSTDTAAIEIAYILGADLIVKCTKVNGLFTDDPTQLATAQHIKNITYTDFIRDSFGNKKYKVIDYGALFHALQIKHTPPIEICKITTNDTIKTILMGENVGSLIEHTEIN